MSALVGARRAHAQRPPSPDEITVSVELHAPPGCGRSDDLERRVELRSDRIRFVRAADASRNLEATLEPGGGGVSATLALVQPNGRRSSRRLRAGSCDEALDALALVATVMLDPTATLEPAAEPDGTTTPPTNGSSEPAPDPGATPPGKPDPTRAKPSAEAEKPPERAAPDTKAPAPKQPDEPEIDDTPPEPPSPPEPIRLSGSVGAVAQAVSGPAPGVLPGGGLYGSVSLERSAPFAPYARLGVARSLRGGFDSDWGTARFVLDSASLDLCPLRVGPRELALRACGHGSAGFLTSAGSNTDAPEEDTRPWSAVGLSALVSVRAHAFLEITISATVARPLIRDAMGFSAETDTGLERRVIHQIPSLMGTGALAVGLRFE